MLLQSGTKLLRLRDAAAAVVQGRRQRALDAMRGGRRRGGRGGGGRGGGRGGVIGQHAMENNQQQQGDAGFIRLP